MTVIGATTTRRYARAMPPRRGWVRPLAVGCGAVILIVAAIALFPREKTALGFCPGQSGHARTGARYALALPVQRDTVAGVVDFDGHLWRAVGDHVTTNGLVRSGATTIDGSIFLVNAAEATFNSPGAFATLLPLTRADGCTSAPVVRSGLLRAAAG